MKKLLFALTSTLSLFVASSAFAGPPVCGASTPRGTVCYIGTDLRTSCGNNLFLAGSVTDAKKLEEGCDAARRASGTTQNAPTTKSASPVKPKDSGEVRQPDAGSEGAEVGEEGSSGKQGAAGPQGQRGKQGAKTKSMAPSPVKPKGSGEVRQPDAGSEGAEVGEEGSSGSSGSKP